MRFVTVAARSLLIAFLCVPCAALAADSLSDLIDAPLTQSEAIPAWAAGETYQPGTERTAPNPDLLDPNGDPTVFIWQMSDDVEHTAGAAWDAAERDHWTAIGAYSAPSAGTISMQTGALGLGAGNRCIWNRTDPLPDYAVPLDGQTIASADTTHPDLWAVRSVSTLIAAFDDTAKTITLKNYNTEQRFARAGTTAGVEQDDATAANGLSTAANGSHVHRTYTGNGGSVYASNGAIGMKNGDNNWQNNRSWTGANVLQAAGNHAHTMGSTDAETRPINVAEIWCVIARSQSVVKATNEPTAGQTLIANGDGTATWTTP